MLGITIIAVGGLKEKYLADASFEYQKRLSAFCRLNIVEIAEHRLPQNPAASEIERGLFVEGRDILAKLPDKSCIIPLCVEGRSLTSPEFASFIDKTGVRYPRIAFIIGGSHGLSGEVKKRAELSLSMSGMTFPHQLARVMLLEQLYRAFSISHGLKYHK